MIHEAKLGLGPHITLFGGLKIPYKGLLVVLQSAFIS